MGNYIQSIVTYQVLKKYLQLSLHCLQELLFSAPDHSLIYRSLDTYLRSHGISRFSFFDSSKQMTISLFPYSHKLIRQTIQELKFKNTPKHAQYFGSHIGEVLLETLSELEQSHNFSNPILCVVPTAPGRLRIRGYCVPSLLLKHVALVLGTSTFEYRPALLKTTGKRPPQSTITSREERLVSPRNHYKLAAVQICNGRNIVLVDDVHTTGSTLNECSRILLRAGAQRVVRITIAH